MASSDFSGIHMNLSTCVDGLKKFQNEIMKTVDSVMGPPPINIFGKEIPAGSFMVMTGQTKKEFEKAAGGLGGLPFKFIVSSNLKDGEIVFMDQAMVKSLGSGGMKVMHDSKVAEAMLKMAPKQPKWKMEVDGSISDPSDKLFAKVLQQEFEKDMIADCFGTAAPPSGKTAKIAEFSKFKMPLFADEVLDVDPSIFKMIEKNSLKDVSMSAKCSHCDELEKQVAFLKVELTKAKRAGFYVPTDRPTGNPVEQKPEDSHAKKRFKKLRLP